MKTTCALSVLGLLAFSGVAMASPVTSTFNNVSPSVDMALSLISPTPAGGTTSAGLFNWTGTMSNPAGLQGNYLAFCIELTQNVAPGNSYTYDMAPLELAPQPGTSVTPMGGAKASALRELFGRFYSPSFGSDINGPGISAEEAAAMQLSIWEIVYETTPSGGPGPGAAFGLSFDILSGNVFFSGNATVLGLATTFLSALDGTGPQAVDLYALVSDDHQDMIVPGPGALALLGLAGAATARRRR